MITMPLKAAEAYARKILDELAPYCERGEIAGSTRRKCPVVHDIDLVVLASDWDGLRARALALSHEICSGEQVFRIETRTGVQVDIYRARRAFRDLLENRPTNFGSLLLCRTGSAAHNIMLCERAKAKGWHWQPHQGLFNAKNELLASETEEEIFKALGMGFVPPEQRQWGDERGVGSEVGWEIPAGKGG
jgi:DNA polymerase (family 10)